MLYGWSNPEVIKNRMFLDTSTEPNIFFSIIIPCYQEQGVIGKTLEQFFKQTYPKTLYEVFVVIRQEDTETKEEIQLFLEKHVDLPCKLIQFEDGVKRKPRHLNEALVQTKGNYIAVFDAEDIVHPELLEKVNTNIVLNGESVIQTTISLTNWSSSIFSLHACLEYYMWFQSRLPWFAKQELTPLGGTGVFFPRSVILNQHGWEESHLTEDAKIGVDFSIENIPVRVIGDERYATIEHVPFTLSHFIRQRTRWTMGFFQIVKEGNWKRLSPLKQIIFLSVFLYPVLSVVFYLGLIFSVVIRLEMPLLLSLFTFLPLGLLLFQFGIIFIALFEMLKNRKEKWKFPLAFFLFIVTYLPYQIIMVISTIRAIFRLAVSDMSWEKTSHINARKSLSL